MQINPAQGAALMVMWHYGNLNYYFLFMPFLLFIGASYLILGIRVLKLRTKLLIPHLIISILLILWIICCVIFNFFIKEKSSNLNTISESSEIIVKTLSLIFGFLFILVPQIIIGLNLYKLDNNHNAT